MPQSIRVGRVSATALQTFVFGAFLKSSDSLHALHGPAEGVSAWSQSVTVWLPVIPSGVVHNPLQSAPDTGEFETEDWLQHSPNQGRMQTLSSSPSSNQVLIDRDYLFDIGVPGQNYQREFLPGNSSQLIPPRELPNYRCSN